MNRRDGTYRRTLHRCPLLVVAGVFICGMTAGRYAALSAGFWMVLGTICLVGAVITIFRRHLHFITAGAVAMTIFAIAAGYMQTTCFSLTENHIVTYTANRRIPATVRGTIVTRPRIYPAGRTSAGGYRRGPRTTFVVRAENIAVTGSERAWANVTGLVRVTVSQGDRKTSAGMQVELVGWIGRYSKAKNPGQFDYSKSTNRKKLVWMSVPCKDGVKILSARSMSWFGQIVWRLRTASREHLSGYPDDRASSLLNAMITGERNPSLRNLNSIMARAGISHFLSISGLHLGVLLGFIYLLCRLITLSPSRSAVVVLTALCGYVLMAEARAPLLRSAIMATALCVSIMIRRRYSALNALAAAAICLLAINPLELFDAGFQLSFAIVGGLIVAHRPMRKLLFGRFLRTRGLMVFRGSEKFRRWLYYSASNLLIDAATVCLTAYLVAVPLVAYHFGTFSPYAPILSLLLFPFVLAVLIPGYVSMAIALPLPNLSYAVGQIASFAAEVMSTVVGWIGELAGLSFEVRPVTICWVLLYYAIGIMILARKRLAHGKAWAIAGVMILAAATAYTQRPATLPAAAELNLLAVGNGQCAVLVTPAGKTWLLDAGTIGDFDAYRSALRPFLRVKRLAQPQTAIISHANIDHYNALLNVPHRHRLRKVYLNNYFGLADGTKPIPPTEKKMLDILTRRNTNIIRLRAGMSIDLDERTRIEVLWPPTQKRSDLSLNDTSLVLRIICDDKSILLTGDIDKLAQSALINSSQPIHCDALVLPHHGAWTSTLDKFVKTVKPKIVLVSGSYQRSSATGGSRAHRNFYADLKRKCEFYNTGRRGWIQVRFGAGQINVETMR